MMRSKSYGKLSDHDKVLQNNLQYLRESGYVIIISDAGGRSFKPDILAMHPKTKRLLWVEVVNVKHGKTAFLDEEKAQHAGHVTEALGGEVAILYVYQDELLTLPEEEEPGDTLLIRLVEVEHVKEKGVRR